jgi:hypothetical protein
VFVSYHHGTALLPGDQAYYDHFSQHVHDRYEAIQDRSLRGRVNSSDLDYVLRCVREQYVTGTSCTIVLVGAATYRRKFVDWEMEATLDRQHALIGVALPTWPGRYESIPARLLDNIASGFAGWLGWDQILQVPPCLPREIADACQRSKTLIRNDRPAMTRNRSDLEF